VLADAYANAVFALGPKAGMALIAKENGVEGVIVDSNGRIHASKGLGDVARVPERIELATPPAQSAQKF
jgi:thiamine biosynthesis lipoprotein ApbE